MRREVANVVCLPLGSIVEVFFNIDINIYTPQTKLAELQNLTLSEIETTSENYLPILVPPGGFIWLLSVILSDFSVYPLTHIPSFTVPRLENEFKHNSGKM